MEEKELRIQVPEGYEIDTENSTFECIKFKKKPSNFSEIKNLYVTETMCISAPCNSNNYKKKLSAINQLMFVAKYLNDSWVPDSKNKDIYKRYYLYVHSNKVQVGCHIATSVTMVYFKSEELAQLAINILGEETIKIALSNEY